MCRKRPNLALEQLSSAWCVCLHACLCVAASSGKQHQHDGGAEPVRGAAREALVSCGLLQRGGVRALLPRAVSFSHWPLLLPVCVNAQCVGGWWWWWWNRLDLTRAVTPVATAALCAASTPQTVGGGGAGGSGSLQVAAHQNRAQCLKFKGDQT